MFLQHWVTCWCRRPSVEQTIGAAPPPLINPFPEQLRASAIDVTMWWLWSCCLRWSVLAVYSVVCCKQTCLHVNIYLGNRACFIFFSVLTLFISLFFNLRSVGYIASYKLNFQNWKFSSQGAALTPTLPTPTTHLVDLKVICCCQSDIRHTCSHTENHKKHRPTYSCYS